MELIFKDIQAAKTFCEQFTTAIQLTETTVHFEHSDFQELPKVGKRVIDILAPYGVTGTKLGSSIDAAKWQKINTPIVVKEVFTFDDIVDCIQQTIGDGAITMLKMVGNGQEVKYENIPEQLLKNLQDMVIESCSEVIGDKEETELFRKKFTLSKVFEDGDCVLEIGRNNKGEKVYWFFLDSDRYRYADDYFISANGMFFYSENSIG
jgi:hypothetical protein